MSVLKIPTWESTEHKDVENMTPMELFIADWEPEGEDAKDFREKLAEAVNASIKEALANLKAPKVVLDEK